MKDRNVNIKIMSKKEYMNLYGQEYNDGTYFDYPLCELEYIIESTEINNLALIENRLFEYGE